MSKKSDAVKKWRNESKKRMIKSMGGKCSICEYNKCHAALEFHHIDPNVKEIGLGSIITQFYRFSPDIEICTKQFFSLDQIQFFGYLAIFIYS